MNSQEIILSKICTKCNIDKPLTEYHNRKNGKYGKASQCKSCVNINPYPRDISITELKCTKCNNIKPLSEFPKDKNNKLGVTTPCKECKNKRCRDNYKNNIEYEHVRNKEYRNTPESKLKEKIRKQQYYRDNKEFVDNRNKKYRKNNKEKLNKKNRERQRIYHKENCKNPLHKIKISVRNIINKAITRKGYKKHSKTEIILGCTFEEFYNHIESKFNNTMSWDNRSDWHIDHIVPISFGITLEEIIKLNHYTNLRPLWGNENLEKSSKLTDDSINHPIYKEIIELRNNKKGA